MESYARNFIRVSILSLLLGMLLGLAMAGSTALTVYIPVHTHLLLIGFMAMMIFGVGYHIIPRFQGHAQIPWAWATLHFWLASAGLVLMLLGWVLRIQRRGPSWILELGGGLEFTGVIVFLVIIWRGLRSAKGAR